VIPSFNAEARLAAVLSKLQCFLPVGSIIVVDDGSFDRTAALASAHGCQVIRHSVNLGKGMALRSGFRAALAGSAEYVVTLDADGQHDPSYLPLLWKAMEQDGLDIVIGERRRDGSMPTGRRMSNLLNSMIVSVFSGQRVADSQSGFRMIRARVLRSLCLHSRRYELETELLLRASLAGFRIGSVKIPTIYAGEKSHIRPWDALRFVRLYLARLFAN
jgi:glycosyltransferase involved in cell wall biosynthesis